MTKTKRQSRRATKKKRGGGVDEKTKRQSRRATKKKRGGGVDEDEETEQEGDEEEEGRGS